MSLLAQLAGNTSYNPVDALVVSLAAGLLAHQVYKRREPTPYTFLSATACIFLASLATLHQVFGLSLISAAQDASKWLAVYLTALAVSIVTYRVGPWHPLANYPGPLICKITQVYWFIFEYRGDARKKLLQLHQKYGKDLRLGTSQRFQGLGLWERQVQTS